MTHIAEGLDWLGPHLRQDAGQLLMTPAAKRITAMLRHVRAVLQGQKSAAAGPLSGHLNPSLRGWAMSHRQAVRATAFQAVAHAICQALWRWATRRPPHKGVPGGKARDVHPVGKRHWVFSGTARGPQGSLRVVPLLTAHRVPIPRHTQSNGAAHPDAPPWEPYVEKRLALKMAASLKGRSTLLALWRRHGGRCPQCGEAMTTRTGWHRHHRGWRSQGGRDTADTRVLRHPTCHSHIHHALGSTRLPPPVPRGLGKA